MNIKYVAIIQCDLTQRRCSGIACTDAFYKKEGMFENYEDDVRYISFTCGGCCGKNLAAKLEQFAKRSKTFSNVNKDDVVIHLSSCMVTDNHHSDRCPHIDYIKRIIDKKGYKNIVEKSYIYGNTQKKREKGIYKTY